VQDHQFLVSRPPLPEKGPLPTDLASSISEAPEAEENQEEDDAKVSEDETSSMTSPPPALSGDHVEELASSSTSAQRAAVGEAFVQEDDLELFDFMSS
jgi:hypothetical protein